MTNPNRSANPANWGKWELIDIKIFPKYSDYAQFVEDMKKQGYRTRTTRVFRNGGRRKVFVYRVLTLLEAKP